MKRSITFIMGIIVGIAISLASCSSATHAAAKDTSYDDYYNDDFGVALYLIENAGYECKVEDSLNILWNYIEEEEPDYTIFEAKDALRKIDSYYSQVIKALNDAY